jgi:hypothetical protein
MSSGALGNLSWFMQIYDCCHCLLVQDVFAVKPFSKVQGSSFDFRASWQSFFGTYLPLFPYTFVSVWLIARAWRSDADRSSIAVTWCHGSATL